MRLIASPHLAEEDIEAIAKGYKARADVFRRSAELGLSEVADELSRDRLNALAWLITQGALEIRLAFRVNLETGRLERGIYHEKIGVFTDAAENAVAFSGSSNETVGGLIQNFESIDAYWSWDDPHERALAKIRDFDQLWFQHQPTKGLTVEDFTAVSREILEKLKTAEPPEFDPEEIQWRPRGGTKSASRPKLPAALSLREYQKEAIRAWLKANGQGVLEMATGTGKTITALAAASALSSEMGLQALILVCPYRHLVSQWRREAESFGMRPILAFETVRRWADELSDELSAASVDAKRFLCVITTNATFSSDVFQARLAYFPKRTLIVADEVHNLGAPKLASMLPASIALRLGLSATPERWFDPEGTEQILNYFGPVLEPRLTLRRALELKVLVPYRYIPILVELTESEREEYLELSARIAKAAAISAKADSSEVLTSLLLRRARLVASASNKLAALRELGVQLKNETHMLFYCGDGTVETESDLSVSRQVDEVTRILGSELGIRVARYTADEDLEERERLREELDTAELQGLVAIRCLDEGVDIPSVRTAVILASSTNPRQFIQRRGRILRRNPGKEHAAIFDMIVVPPEEVGSSESERSLLRKELLRFVEFADLAMNSGEARAKIVPLQKRFDLMDL